MDPIPPPSHAILTHGVERNPRGACTPRSTKGHACRLLASYGSPPGPRRELLLSPCDSTSTPTRNSVLHEPHRVHGPHNREWASVRPLAGSRVSGTRPRDPLQSNACARTDDEGISHPSTLAFHEMKLAVNLTLPRDKFRPLSPIDVPLHRTLEDECGSDLSSRWLYTIPRGVADNRTTTPFVVRWQQTHMIPARWRCAM
ncbi:hypothetical protein JHW43_007890 [Diplocarpon mali]|nr:hypothetical protein JHW43_007890 [Diplocarpon mali]